MSLSRTILATALASAAVLSPGARAAAQVQDLQIAPVNITMSVGETRTFLATAYDQRGNPQVATGIGWISTNLNVVRVETDPSTPNVVTVVAVGQGTASHEARVGTVRTQAVIQVVAAGAPTDVPGRADTTLAANVVGVSSPQVARIEPEISNSSPACRVGSFIENDLLVTTYEAIRGAERIAVMLSDGQRIADAGVAAHDPQANIAVLHIPLTRSGRLNRGADPSTGDRVWVFAQPDCRLTAVTTVQVSDGASPTVHLERELAEQYEGAPVVDQNGSLVAISSAGPDAVRVSQIGRLVATAQGNVRAGRVPTATEVATREHHRFGSLALQSQAFGASVRVTALETWHWPQLDREGRLPLSITGPEGRYRIELLQGGQVQNTQTAELRPGTTTRITLNPTVAGPTPTPQPTPPPQVQSGGGGFPVPILIVGGLAAAGAGAFLLLGGGGDDFCDLNPTHPDCINGPPPPSRGGIRIRIPIPVGN